MNEDQSSFEEFMKRREAAARAYVRGDADPVGSIAARNDPATFFSPKGDYRQGAKEVLTTYERDAASFEDGGETHFEILHMAAGDGIGYWVGFQRAKARLKGKPEPIPMDLRVTEIFRRDGSGEWKMIHRHADMLQSESGKEPS